MSIVANIYGEQDRGFVSCEQIGKIFIDSLVLNSYVDNEHKITLRTSLFIRTVLMLTH